MLKSTRSNEVAILGYGCRLPGADGPDAFWDVLSEGRCTVTEIQETRWPKHAFGHTDPTARGKSYVWAAGQLDDPWAFDPDFFGVSPREAEQMDPQQRLILQVAWEALEHAGLPPSSLPKDTTGVYIGASSSDYSNRFYLDPSSIDSQFMTGNSLSLISNRLSYVLDLHGPSQTVDTACSSGLYALHYAVEALRSGLIDTAIVGAVNMLLSPFPFIGFSRASMLSKQGLCRAFDANGDGYVRSEGAAVFVLRAEHAAIAEGDRIRGYVAATGVNTDGRTPGVSQPSAERQAALLRNIYEDGGIDPNDLAFVEAHGTGTAVGDPIEANAIGSVLGVGRTRPLPIGSVKTNVGHLEAGAGIVGLLKAQMALERGAAPASLHFDTPNPNIDFEALNLKVVDAAIALPKAAEMGRPRLAGVNSFGFGGANGHAVLRQVSVAERREARPAPAPLILSARSQESLATLAAQYRERLTTASDDEAARIANAAAYQRERLPHRLITPAATRAGQIAALEAFAADPATRAAATGQAPTSPTKTAFVFSGNGAQWAGMGREAHAADPVFRETFDRISDMHATRYDIRLTEALHDPELEPRLALTSLAQPLLFAIQAGLVDALAHAGLRPDAVIGHSVGEVAAAWAAGVYSLEDAVRLIGARSANQEMLRGLGLMAAVAAPAEEIEARLAEEGLADIWVAADNSPRGATISAAAAALDAFEEIARASKWPMRRLQLDYPFHSGFADPMRDKLIEDLAWLKPEEARIPFVSTAYGRIADGHELGPAYWWKNIRSAVQFRNGVEHLEDAGCGVFVEIGPKPVLRGYLRDCLAARDVTLRYTPTLEEAGGDAHSAAACALALGAGIDNTRFFGPDCGTRVDLPRYPWRNRPFRAEDTPEAAPLLHARRTSPLLGQPVRPGAQDWRRELDVASPAYMADHVVQGAVVAPAAAMIEMAFAAGAEALGEDDDASAPPIELKNFTILRPIALDGGARELRVTATEGRAAIRIATRRRLSDEAWSEAAGCRLRRACAAPPSADARPSSDAQIVKSGPLYAALDANGLTYGASFRLAEQVSISDEANAEVSLAPPNDDPNRPHMLHPASLDATLHGLMALLGIDGRDGLFLPVSVETARLYRRSSTVSSAEISITRRSTRSVTANILLRDACGEVIASFERFRFKAAPAAAPLDPETCRYETRLALLPAPGERDDPVDILAWGRDNDLLTDAPAAPEAQELIAEAATLRICLDALRSQTAKSALADRLRQLLEREGLYTRDHEGRLIEVGEAAPPDISGLIEGLITEAPRASGTVAYLARLSAELPEILTENAGERLAPTRAERSLQNRDQIAEDRWRSLANLAVGTLGASAAPGQSVLLLGAPPLACVREFDETGLHRLWIVDPDDGGDATAHAHHTAQWRSSAALENGPKFDLIVTADPFGAPPSEKMAIAAANLAPGGVLMALSPASDFLDSLTPGSRRSTTPPTGLRVLGEAHFSNAAAKLTVLRRPAENPATGETTPSIHLISSPGGETQADAVRAALEALEVVVGSPDDPWEESEVVLLCGATSDNLTGDIAARMMATHPILANAPDRRPRRLWLVTEGGAPAGEAPPRPAEAAIWGFGRVIANEHPDVEVRLIDLDPVAGIEINAANLTTQILNPGAEREVVLRNGHNFAPRIQRSTPLLSPDTQLSLTQAKPGDIESLAWRPTPLALPKGDEVEIEVAATGLNFRDVMWAQGLLPEEALEDGFAGPTLGMECAGIVIATGPEASRFRPGDRVIAYAPACFAQRVTVSETAAAPIPDGVEAEAAAAIPTAFLTAQYALAELANLRAGEVVMIHGAAGGVGLAAIQIAINLGARVIATAGSPAKRALALQLGAEAVFDGRALGFAEQVVAHTGGVDVVLNSLAGEAMERGIECLKPFGRFIELGKRDFYADSDLGLRPFRRNLSYFGVDADQLMKDRPDVAGRLLEELCEAFTAGALVPPPVTLFAAEDVVDAFRLMQKSGHIGKIIVRPPAPSSVGRASVAIRPDAAYLVIGGASGFGAATAEWLAKQGARRLHLASRTASPDADGAAAIDRMRAMGATVTLHAADVADEAAMTTLFATIDAEGAPLKGIVHAAMVLDDALFSAQDRLRIERVLRPKVEGAAVLDRLTRERGGRKLLDFLVAYSSATTLVGNPGQSAYVAANAYLEALIRARRQDGLPGLAIAWGAVADTGVLAREAATDQVLSTRLGVSRMTASIALDELGRRLGGEAAALAFGDIDWSAAKRELALLSSPLFEHIDVREDNAPPPSGELIDLLRGLTAEEAMRELSGVLAAEAARILRLPPAEIDHARPLTDMGFDSLMAMDLRMALEERLGLEVPLMSLAGGANLRDVARLAYDRLADGVGEAANPVVEAIVERHVNDRETGLTRADVEAFAEQAKSTESLLS